MVRDWFKAASNKTIGVSAAIVLIILVAVPTAIWFGAASFLFDSPAKGLRSFFIVLGIGVVVFVGEIVTDLLKERRKNRR